MQLSNRHSEFEQRTDQAAVVQHASELIAGCHLHRVRQVRHHGPWLVVTPCARVTVSWSQFASRTADDGSLVGVEQQLDGAAMADAARHSLIMRVGRNTADQSKPAEKQLRGRLHTCRTHWSLPKQFICELLSVIAHRTSSDAVSAKLGKVAVGFSVTTKLLKWLSRHLGMQAVKRLQGIAKARGARIYVEHAEKLRDVTRRREGCRWVQKLVSHAGHGNTAVRARRQRYV